MLVPSGGFVWVIGGRDVAPTGQSECVLTIGAGFRARVDQLIRRAERAGAAVVTQPGDQGWAYAGTFTDPDGHLWMVARDSSSVF